jgi:hypothetical protein
MPQNIHRASCVLGDHVCWSAFQNYNKIPKIINLKEEKFVLAHNFGDFSPWSVSPIVLAYGKAPHMAGGCGK